jgi:hypothetical protein
LLRAFSTSPTARDGMISEGTVNTMKHHDPQLVVALRELAFARLNHERARAANDHARAVELAKAVLDARLTLALLIRCGTRRAVAGDA